MKKFRCSLCKNFAALGILKLLRHVREVHQFGPSLNFTCGINGCVSTFKTDKCESMRAHIYSKHRSIIGVDSPNPDSNRMEEEVEPESMEIKSDPITAHEDTFPEEVFPEKRSTKDAVTLFILKTLSERNVTKRALDGIVNEMKIIVEALIEEIQNSLIKSGVAINLSDILNADTLRPFDGLDTEYLRTKYMKQRFTYIEPIERTLGTSCGQNKHGKFVKLKDRCYDVPLIPQLQQLLKCDVVAKHVLNTHATNSGIMADYCDGDAYKSNPLFQRFPNSLEIHMYYDEVEICNPIGSKKNIHKLGLFYFSLGNLPPEQRSKLKSIFLLNISYFSDIKAYGINTILEPIVEELKSLEQGINFYLPDGSVRKLHGTLTIFSADNLSAQLVGGYKALNAAFRKCQGCMVTGEEMQKVFSERELIMRTKDVYDAQCSDLQNTELHDDLATSYGINTNSILNELSYFHVTGGLVKDIMHDMCEGTFHVAVLSLLRYLILEVKAFSLKLLNQRIQMFQYGRKDKLNLPTLIEHKALISNDKKLSQNASQMWCLARALPFLVGDKVDDRDEKWKNYLCFLTIVEYVFAPVTTIPMAEYIGQLVELYLTNFVSLFTMRLTPKMHYSVHLASWTKKIGPLIHAWCMRFEAKHQYFKHLAKTCRNFKNILKTLSDRHQMYACFTLSEKKHYLKEITEVKKCNSCSVRSLKWCDKLLEYMPGMLTEESTVYSAKKVTIYSIEYMRQDVVLLPLKAGHPQFGLIQAMIVTEDSKHCLFVLQMMETITFNEHYHAYEVRHTQDITNISTAETFLDRYPLTLNYTFDKNICGKHFVRLKHMYVH